MKKRFLMLIMAIILASCFLSFIACVSPLNKDDAESRIEKYILFGSYPQTDVTKSMGSILSYGDALPTSGEDNGWTDYGYYIDGSISNYMWYKDVENDGECYRAVYFVNYRPDYTVNRGFSSNSYQDANKFYTGNVYWFKFEPINWRILSEINGEAIILSEMIIDSQDYNYTTSSTMLNGQTVYASNYANSTIRKWLNENFYDTAFTELQQQKILTTTVDNSVASTGYNSNQYTCNNTQDKVFLLSVKEVTSTSYGFTSAGIETIREKQNTDYAKAQGCYSYFSEEYEGNGCWWLRSSDGTDSGARAIIYNGGAYMRSSVDCTHFGVVPALRIKLS